MLVHGEQNEMMRLKAALIREYEENDETLQIHSPANSETVSLHFRGEKMAKVLIVCLIRLRTVNALGSSNAIISRLVCSLHPHSIQHNAKLPAQLLYTEL